MYLYNSHVSQSVYFSDQNIDQHSFTQAWGTIIAILLTVILSYTSAPVSCVINIHSKRETVINQTPSKTKAERAKSGKMTAITNNNSPMW